MSAAARTASPPPPPAGRWKTGCLAKVESDSEYAEVMLTVPKTKAPRTLAEFGYHFDSAGKLVQIASGKPFAWLGQKHYDKLGNALIEDIYALLESRYGLERRMLPIDAPAGTPQCPIFVSPNYSTCDVLVFLCQGSGAVRPGMWARALCINDSLATGTIFTYLDGILAKGWGVVVLNPNENTVAGELPEPRHPSAAGATEDSEESIEDYWLNTPDAEWKSYMARRARTEELIPGNERPELHALYVWDNFVRESKARLVPIVAHSYGGVCTTTLVRERLDEVVARVPCVVLTDAINNINARKDKGLALDFMRQRSCNWVASEKPLDTPEKSTSAGCVEVSAGHLKHEWTSASCVTSALKFLAARVDAGLSGPTGSGSGSGSTDAGKEDSAP